MYDKAVFRERIFMLRKSRGLSQSKLAETLGLSTQAISKWETGVSIPDIDALIYISNYFNVTLDSLFSVKSNLDTILKCPTCGGKLTKKKSNDKTYYCCIQNHKFYIEEGVIYFGTREIKGEEWSLTYRNYDHYLVEAEAAIPDFYQRSDISSDELKWQELSRRKPKLILDIASGTGIGIKYMLKQIDWPCTVIFTDLSHRILKWNRRYISEKIVNPYVDIYYLACDASNLPIFKNSVDCVLSNAGFESMQHKMIDGFKEAIRIVKESGAVIYNRSLVDDHDSENTKKWVDLYLNIKDSVINPNKMIDIHEWHELCKKIGFNNTKSMKVYGEMNAPDTEVFPFENQILRWMAEYICVSTIK